MLTEVENNFHSIEFMGCNITSPLCLVVSLCNAEQCSKNPSLDAELDTEGDGLREPKCFAEKQLILFVARAAEDAFSLIAVNEAQMQQVLPIDKGTDFLIQRSTCIPFERRRESMLSTLVNILRDVWHRRLSEKPFLHRRVLSIDMNEQIDR